MRYTNDVTITPLGNPRGKIERLIAVIEDLTERGQTERATIARAKVLAMPRRFKQPAATARPIEELLGNALARNHSVMGG